MGVFRLNRTGCIGISMELTPARGYGAGEEKTYDRSPSTDGARGTGGLSEGRPEHIRR